MAGNIVTDRIQTDTSYASSLAIETNGAERLRIDSSGNVGVGTTSPTQRLHVLNSTNTATSSDNCGVFVSSTNRTGYIQLDSIDGDSSSVVLSTAGTEVGRVLYNNLNNYMAFRTNGSNERMRIDSNGLIGVKGAASTSWSSTYQVIQYNAGPALWSANNTNINLSSNIYNDGTIRYITSAGAGYFNASTGGITLNSLQSGTAGNAVTVGAIFNVSTTDCVMTTANGGLGYGTGAGGTVTQATSKSTGVTLNKPTGKITMNSAALLSATSVTFILTNSLVGSNDLVLVNTDGFSNYSTQCVAVTGSGTAYIRVTNNSGGSLSDAVVVNFAIIKGATS